MARLPKKPKEETGFFESYAHFSRTLRAWLVAYGVGVPVLLVSQEFIARAIIRAGTGGLITWLFLAGVAIQVLAALSYKYSMAYLYFAETDSLPDDAWQVGLSAWLSRAVWLEMLFDVVSIGLFVYGTFKVVAAVLAPA
ncbi:MAG TPA: hypothetical protein VFK12_03925 [Gammaproteobacteria bacterium]|jgi:hypothetical protein|nr:hypothetical protein [Gammaproteobacteria bacterium]